MRSAPAFLMLVLASPVAAAPFEDLKEAYASCLRSELGAPGGRRPMTRVTATAFERCAAEGDRLDRADPRRLRDGHGRSPSSWQVIESVFGAGRRGRFAGILFR